MKQNESNTTGESVSENTAPAPKMTIAEMFRQELHEKAAAERERLAAEAKRMAAKREAKIAREAAEREAAAKARAEAAKHDAEVRAAESARHQQLQIEKNKGYLANLEKAYPYIKKAEIAIKDLIDAINRGEISIHASDHHLDHTFDALTTDVRTCEIAFATGVGSPL